MKVDMRRVLLLTFFLFVNVSLLANDDVWTFTENVSGIDMSFVITSNTEGNRTVKVEKRKNKEDYDNNPFYNDIPAIDPNTEGPVTIPEKVMHNGVEYKVTEIGYSAFGDCKKITSVKLPSSIQKIDVFAFADVTFETITLPEGLTTLEGAAFLDSKIKYVEIPSTVTIFGKTGNMETEGAPFSAYGMMEYIKFKSSNIEFGDYSMFYNENTVIIMEAETPPVVSEYVFYDSAHNPASFSKIIVPDGSKEAYQSANFWTDFKSKIYAKSEYTDYTIVTDPTIILSETSFTYDGTPKTPTVTVKDGNTVIPESEYTVTYSNNTEVGSARVIISNNEGGNYIVNGSATFTIVKDPDGIIVFASDKVKAACVAKWDKEKDGVKDGELSYAEAAAVTSLVDENDWNDPFAELSVDDSEFSFDEFQYFIGVTSLIGYEFGDCENLTSIILPNSITSIGDGAFYRCKKLTSIHIPASVTDIFMTNNSELSPSPAFNSEYLQTITVDPENTKYASPTGSNVIIDTESNTLILGCGNTDFSKIPNTVTTIRQDAFAGVTFGNPKVSLPTSVTDIMEYAFRGSNITSINLGELSNLTTIGKQAFSDCTGLTEVTLPAGITEMGISVFGDCDNIVKVVSKMENPLNNQGDNHIIETYNDAVLYVPQGKVETYRSAGWEEILYDVELKSFRAIIDGDGTLPDAIEGLTYNGKDQKLIIPGTYRDGMMEYSLDGETYSTSVPTGKNAGDYTVYYRKVGESAASTLTATIEYTFTAQTTEDIEIVFTVLDETAKTCQVGYLDGSRDKVAVDRTAINGAVTIPQIVEGYTVVKIGKYAFYNVNGMTSVTIPNTITAIDEFAFNYCHGLTSFELPASVTNIGIGAISGFSNVTSMSVAEGNQYFDSRNNCNAIIEKATNKLLFGCKTTIIPSSVTELGVYSFDNVLYNSTLSIPSTILKIDDYTFVGSNWTIHVEHPTPLEISENVFGNMSNSTTLRVPVGSKAAYAEATGWNSFGTIEEGYDGCAFIAKTAEGIDIVFTVLDESAKTCQVGYLDGSFDKPAIDRDAVEGAVTIPGSVNGYTVVKIGEYAFDNTIKMTSVTIPESVTSIDENAFYNCNGLTSFELPANVVSLGNRALSSLRSVEFLKVAEGNEVYDSRGDCNAIIETATNKLLFGSKITTIPADVTEIGESAFENLDNYTFTIPSTVTKIDDNAFYFCANWALQVEHTSPLEISENVFSSMGNTTTLRVPLGCKSDYAEATGWNSFGTIEEGYDGCTFTAKTVEGIDMVFTILDESEKTCQVGYLDGSWENVAVDRDAVNGAVTIPSTYNGYTVVKIGKHAFNNIWGMTSVTIPETVTYLDDYAFHNSFSLTSLELSASVTDIGNNALSYLSNVTSIKVAEGNTKYDSRGDCNAIIETATNKLLFGCKKTIIPASVTEIGSYAFQSVLYDCIISIPSTITKIDDYAFGGLIMALQVEHTTPLEINETVFDNNVTSSTLYVPAGCKAAYEAADYWKEFMAIEEIGIVLPADKLFSGSNLWAGYVAAEDLAIPTGLEAYVITNLGTTTATASPLNYIPQGEPVLLKRDDTTISSYEFVSGTGTAPTMNLLRVYDTDKSLSNREGFILYNDEFVLVNEGTLPAGRVFLPANNALLSRGLTRSIEIDDDNATGIEDNKMFVDDADGQWFDLQGRRLEKKPTKKGLYILKGRKVIVK